MSRRPAGPATGELVWISTGRRGIPMHRIDPRLESTPCGRNRVGYGRTLPAADAVERYGAEPCRVKCWPLDGPS